LPLEKVNKKDFPSWPGEDPAIQNDFLRKKSWMRGYRKSALADLRN
jgi:hypothetical protein